MSLTNDGKRSEKIVHDVLRRFNNDLNFCFARLADARAARGALAAAPADFLYFSRGHGGFLEVKSLAHDYRLPAKSVTQLATLKKMQLAGARSWVITHHTALNRWRAVPVDALTLGVPSWVLTEHPTFATADEALLSTGAF